MSKQYSIEEIAELSKALGLREKAQPGHGPNYGSTTQFGAYSGAGVRPDMYSAAMRTQTFLDLVNFVPSDISDQIIEFRTGDTEGTGNASTGWCTTPPTAGEGKVARQTFAWGRLHLGSGSVQLPEIGQRRTYGDVPRNILNAPEMNTPLLPEIMYEVAGETLPESVLRGEMFQVGKRIEIETEKVAVQGSGATANGWFTKFTGLETQVATGKTDSVSGNTAPSLDSIVVTYNASMSSTIIDAVTEMYYAAKQRARTTGMSGVTFALVLGAEMFRALVETWACSYDTDRCAGGTNNPNFTNATEVNRLRLEMITGNYLLIDGDRVPVVFSDGVQFDRIATNTYTGDIFLLPVNWSGRSLLTMEYFNMGNSSISEFADFAGQEVRVLNNGMYLVSKEKSSAFCMTYEFAAKMRFILETPWLAGRVDNITFSYSAATRRADPANTIFHANGGATFRS